MGVVYKAVDRRKLEAKDDNPYVAVKILNDRVKMHPLAFRNFQREASRAQCLSHPNIINVYDFDRDGGQAFMTMEYLQGCTLDALIKMSRLHPVPGAFSLISDICSALICAHSHNIVHTDLKPGNIFVTRNRSAKVLDFGTAGAWVVARGKGLSRSPSKANSTGLTPAYASSRLLMGGSPRASDDVYALGCIIYEILTGRHPYRRVNAVEARRRAMTIPRIKSLSAARWQALTKALALSTSERYSTVSEFVRDFDNQFGPIQRLLSIPKNMWLQLPKWTANTAR